MWTKPFFLTTYMGFMMWSWFHFCVISIMGYRVTIIISRHAATNLSPTNISSVAINYFNFTITFSSDWSLFSSYMFSGFIWKTTYIILGFFFTSCSGSSSAPSFSNSCPPSSSKLPASGKFSSISA